MIMTTRIRFSARSALLVLGAATFALASTFSQAEPALGEPQSRLVHYGDLNLDSPKGITQLYDRIEAASRAVCGEVNQVELTQWRQTRACYAASIARGVAQINNPALTALYAKMSGKPGEHVALLKAR
jgi:UrcA family protein